MKKKRIIEACEKEETRNAVYPLIEWKLFIGNQVFWIDHFIIPVIINTWQWDLHLEDKIFANHTLGVFSRTLDLSAIINKRKIAA